MKKLSTAAKLGKLTEKIQMISLVLILLYFVGRIFVSAFFKYLKDEIFIKQIN